jgi:hypothetical protein
MDGLYFLVMLVGIAWLAIWAARSESPGGEAWSPFDMAPDDAGQPAAAPLSEGWRARHAGGR